MPKKPQKPIPGKIGIWTMMRDVLIASMNKGQFPLALVGMVFIVLIVKMPAADVSQLVFKLLQDVENGRLVSSILFIATGFGWVVHSKWQRKTIDDELQRVAGERNRLQELGLGGEISSSE